MNPQADPELREIQERYAAAWRFHDPDAIMALHTEDTEFRTHGNGDRGRGRAAVRAAAVEMFARFPEFRPEPRRLLVGGDHWVLEWTLFSGEIEFDCVDVITVRDGLVQTKDTYFDAAQLERTTPRPSQD